MNPLPRFSFPQILILVILLALAGGARYWYVAHATDGGKLDPAWEVQGPGPKPALAPLPPGEELFGMSQPTELANLVGNLKKFEVFTGLAPLADREDDKTAHASPGYPWAIHLLAKVAGDMPIPTALRWAHVGLGTLTVVCLFFFVRRAFHNDLVAMLAGVLAAVHPFWILNAAEINDGVLATFLLALSLALGARGGQVGGILTGLGFGLALAGLSLVRAAYLPFAIVALLWYVVRGRKIRMGWFSGLLAILGFANGIGLWAVRNYQTFGEPVPIVTTAYFHLWMGNNPNATGGELDETRLRESFRDENRKALVLAERNQAKRYAMLGNEVLDEIANNPGETVTRRLRAAILFVVGEQWLENNHIAIDRVPAANLGIQPAPEIVDRLGEGLLQGFLFALLFLAFLGWRRSAGWWEYSRIGAIAMIWIPLPYILSHGGLLSGPRLPWDAVLIAFSAYAVGSYFPGFASDPRDVPPVDV